MHVVVMGCVFQPSINKLLTYLLIYLVGRPLAPDPATLQHVNSTITNATILYRVTNRQQHLTSQKFPSHY